MNKIFRNLICFSLMLFGLIIAQAQANAIDDLIKQGQSTLLAGDYYQAQAQFQQAHALASEQQDGFREVHSLILIGNLALQQQQFKQAEQYFTEAWQAIDGDAWPDLQAQLSLYQGKLQLRQGVSEAAKKYFQQALILAKSAHSSLLSISAHINLAALAHQQEKPKAAWQHLSAAQTQLTRLPEQPDSRLLWLDLGYQAQQFSRYQLKPERLELSFNALTTARQQARQNQDLKTEILALNYLADLYEGQKQFPQAIQLTTTAINLAQQQNQHALLIDLDWRLGRIYHQQNQLILASAAYRRAVDHIEAIRIDMLITYKEGRSSFRETLAPVYTGLADVLLKRVQQAPAEQKQDILAEARNTIETFKRRELQDYFQDRCELPDQPIILDQRLPTTAALYPILLPDRLEVIIYSAQGLQHFSSSVSAEKLTDKVQYFASLLRDQGDEKRLLRLSKQLYGLIIKPAEAYLAQQAIDTLLYVPDGVLRLIPLASLYDGKKYLIEKMAIATLPGMTLTASSATQTNPGGLLFVGLSEPGDVVTDIPDLLLSQLVGYLGDDSESEEQESADIKTEQSRDLSRYLRGGAEQETLQSRALVKQRELRKLRELLEKPGTVKGLQEMLALPGVAEEIKQLAALKQSKQLLNEEFSLAGFTEVVEQQPFRAIHIASHGFFGDTADQSFIMTHDRVMNMNKLEELFSSEQFTQHPAELIIFSACQTAEGNDRSPLGISGVALKAKVQSALGSLWPISDEATVLLMNDFYQGLDNPELSKAKALQHAQITLLKLDKFKSPAIWSPYILVGNWQ